MCVHVSVCVCVCACVCVCVYVCVCGGGAPCLMQTVPIHMVAVLCGGSAVAVHVVGTGTLVVCFGIQNDYPYTAVLQVVIALFPSDLDLEMRKLTVCLCCLFGHNWSSQTLVHYRSKRTACSMRFFLLVYILTMF